MKEIKCFIPKTQTSEKEHDEVTPHKFYSINLVEVSHKGFEIDTVRYPVFYVKASGYKEAARMAADISRKEEFTGVIHASVCELDPEMNEVSYMIFSTPRNLDRLEPGVVPEPNTIERD